MGVYLCVYKYVICRRGGWYVGVLSWDGVIVDPKLARRGGWGVGGWVGGWV